MEYTYWLPDEFGEKKEYNTSSNSIVIIGANGSGKSKLGAWIELKDFERVHRIGAQRDLNFNENIQLKNYQEAENCVFYGIGILNNGNTNKKNRWNYGNSYTTKLMDDFENVLAALIALKNNFNDEYIIECRKAKLEGKSFPKIPTTPIDQLQIIWNEVFPHRQLILKDSKFLAKFTHDDIEEEYSATQMSDGERAVLYLAAQVLCVPQNKILIMDEPEIHLHRSLMNRLWTALEGCRSDCLFIYITHDTQFASLHNSAEKIWIKEYDGHQWKLEKIEESELPEELLLDILGNRKNVLFVEGEKDSYDVKLFSAFYRDYYIIPCGSCSQVIAKTKAFMQSSDLHRYNVYGIIDRDFRSEYEIEKYKKDNIYTINVAEVENLFLVENLVRVMANHMEKNENEVFAKVKKYVINERFAKQINGQVLKGVIAQIKYLLSSAGISAKNEEEAVISLDCLLSSIKYAEIRQQQEEKYRGVLDSRNYDDVIRVFNEKGISNSIGKIFDVDNKSYCNLVLRLLNTEKRQLILDSIQPYLPVEIPID